MSELLSESLRKLQKEWRKVALEQHRGDAESRRNSHLSICADALDSIIASAVAQERELADATLKAETWERQWNLRCEMLNKQVEITEKLERELSALKDHRKQWEGAKPCA